MKLSGKLYCQALNHWYRCRLGMNKPHWHNVYTKWDGTSYIEWETCRFEGNPDEEPLNLDCFNTIEDWNEDKPQ